MSVPAPVEILIADVMRDGGSYLLVYRAQDGNTHTLFLPVAQSTSHLSSHLPPTVRNQISGESYSLSWEEAASLGALLTPLLSSSIREGGEARASECIKLLLAGGMKT